MTAAVLFLAATALYYGVLVRVADRPALRIVLARMPVSGRSVGDVFAFVNIAMAAVFQAGLVLLLAALLDVDLIDWLLSGWHPVLVVAAPALALAELALSSMLASIAMAAFSDDGGTEDWRVLMRSGWVGSFMRAGEQISPVAALGFLSIYLGFEEALFRAVALKAFSGFGPLVAGAASCLTFLAAQVAGMPSWRHAVFPLCGAAVMGPVHAALALAGAPGLFLIAVHALFFTAAVAAAPRMASQAGRR